MGKDGADAIPGRRITKGSGGANWMYVDSWHTIGPFPNPQRRNIETKFPPESVIDLDATYPGMDGKPVRWTFLQSPTALCRPKEDPEYAIYYAYSELWFDDAMDLWIAVGSDDYSKLWVEDMLVWNSGAEQKVWNPAEGMRKVHFKKGLNRILYRVENGWRSSSFSMLICMKTQGT